MSSGATHQAMCCAGRLFKQSTCPSKTTSTADCVQSNASGDALSSKRSSSGPGAAASTSSTRRHAFPGSRNRQQFLAPSQLTLRASTKARPRFTRGLKSAVRRRLRPLATVPLRPCDKNLFFFSSRCCSSLSAGPRPKAATAANFFFVPIGAPRAARARAAAAASSSAFCAAFFLSQE